MARCAPLLGLSLVALLASTGSAHAAEYRRIKLSDGRELVAEIEQATDTGLMLSMPQGTTSIGFTQVASLEDVDESVWAAQPSWTIVVVPPTAADQELSPTITEQLAAAVADVPAVVVTSPGRMTRLNTAQRDAFKGCGTDAACIQAYLDQAGAMVAIAARFSGSGDKRNLVVTSSFANAPLARREVSVDWIGNSEAMAGPLRQTVETALHLDPRPLERVLPKDDPVVAVQPSDTTPDKPIKPEKPEKPPKAAKDGPSASALRAMAWVPVPGLPSAARSDWGGFAASWGVVVPGSAAMVGVAGSASFTQPQLLATGIASFYVLTVTANKAIGLRNLDAQITAAPLPGGGAVVGVSGTLGGSRDRNARR